MTRPEPLPVPPTADEEQEIIDFLTKHPDFFSRHVDVLADLPVRHATGPAVSLIERQVGVLRDRNTRLQERLDLLLAAARDNESRVIAVNHLARNLIQADSLTSVVAGLTESLHTDFEVDGVCVALFGPLPQVDGPLWLSRAATEPVLSDFFRQGRIECGPLSADLKALLFPRHSELQSGALVPLDRINPLGLLAIASTDFQRFTPDMGAMFLELTASLAAAALHFHWPKPDDDLAPD